MGTKFAVDNDSCVDTLLQDLQTLIKGRRKQLFTIFRPEEYAIVITGRDVEIPEDLLVGLDEYEKAKKPIRSTFVTEPSDKTRQEVAEVLERLSRVGYNVSAPEKIELRSQTYLVYRFTPDAHKSY